MKGKGARNKPDFQVDQQIRSLESAQNSLEVSQVTDKIQYNELARELGFPTIRTGGSKFTPKKKKRKK